MSLGKMFLSAVLAEGSVSALLELGPIEHLFKPNEAEAYVYVKDFVKKFQALPKAETIEAHTGQELVDHDEPALYYHDLLVKRYIEIELKRGMKTASDQLLPDSKDPMAALKTLMTTAMLLVNRQNASMVSDFRDAYDRIISDYVSKFNTEDGNGLQLGWPYLDEMTGGLTVGDVVSFVGRPAAGKTWQMLYGAHHGWAAAGTTATDGQNHSRMFVSMEMGELAIKQRLSAMTTELPMWKLKNAGLSTTQLKKLKTGLKGVNSYAYPFYVVDGNLAASVEDIWNLARQLKPGAIFIDGAYLLTHPTERDRFRRVAENADLIKKELAPIAPTVCSWQFAKTAGKKKKDEKVTMDDIGYTDAIAQVSSLVAGLFQEESVETMNSRRIEILKGRNGEIGSFQTNWDFDKMNFSQLVEENVSELQFV